MRKLIILRGAQGSGKSTFVKKNDLERFTLSADTIRLMLNSPELTIEYTEMIPQFNNKKTWNILYSLLEERMKKGEFTIVDAVHSKKDDLSVYKKLAEKYRYRLYILDFTKISKEEVYDRNKNREIYKVVPECSIDRAYKNFAKEQIPGAFKIVDPEDFDSILTREPMNYDHYKNVHIIGDIHGCFTALKTYFDNNPYRVEDAYIFVGDYFDRGIENYQTYEFLTKLMDNKNATFLVGNHEDKLYKYACDDDFVLDYDIKNTIEEFESNSLSKSEVRGFIKKLSQIAYLKFRNKTYLVTHGGIPYFPKLPIDYYSTNSFIYGVDKYDVNIDQIYDEYARKVVDKVIQIHGHRNYFKVSMEDYEYSYNLEGDVEHGGDLRVLTLNDDGTMIFTAIKNEVYNENLVEETNIYNLVSSLRKNNYVYEKELGDNISSFNFTKEAFYNRVWDDITTKTRGLFINTSDNRIVARSYNKFFKIGERKETQLAELKNELSYPVNFYLKYNGFLGILSVEKGELFFASKSTNVGNYVDYFKKIFFETFDDDQIGAIKNKIMAEKATFVFEVIDPINDPHIIEYEHSQIVLLDIIRNRIDFEKMVYSELIDFASKNRIETKKLVFSVENVEQFDKVYDTIMSEDYTLDGDHVEGFVLEDSKGFMVKSKSKYYDRWKRLRKVMENCIMKNEFESDSKDELENDFVTYLKNKYENRNVEVGELCIIKEREEFYKTSE